MSKPTYERHWQTQAIVDVLVAMQSGQTLTFLELSDRSRVPVDDVRKRRLQNAKKIAERDHHVLIVTIAGVGVKRLTQDQVEIPIRKRNVRMRGAARRITNTIRDGITDFEALPPEVKSKAYAMRAVAGAVLHFTSTSSQKRLETHAAKNGEINVGRTLEMLR